MLCIIIFTRESVKDGKIVNKGDSCNWWWYFVIMGVGLMSAM